MHLCVTFQWESPPGDIQPYELSSFPKLDQAEQLKDIHTF